MINLLPAGLVGVMIAALMAALMGAMSSVFNSASTLVTLDFYRNISPHANERQLVNFGRAATGVLHGRPCYEVEFDDGTVIVADAEHQWLTEMRHDRGSGAIRTTRELAASVRAYCGARSRGGGAVQVAARHVLERVSRLHL